MKDFVDSLARSLATETQVETQSRRTFMSKVVKTLVAAGGTLGVSSLGAQNAAAAYLYYAQVDGARCRTAPNTSASVYTTFDCNEAIYFSGYVTGTTASACGETSSRWWKTAGGSCYVSDTTIRTFSAVGCDC